MTDLKNFAPVQINILYGFENVQGFYWLVGYDVVNFQTWRTKFLVKLCIADTMHKHRGAKFKASSKFQILTAGQLTRERVSTAKGIRLYQPINRN